MTEFLHRRLEGCGLIEVIVALTVLSVGLLTIAGLVRAVSRQTDHARAESAAALLAQQELGAALSVHAPAPFSREDTLRFGSRDYSVEVALEAAGPDLDRMTIDVVSVGPPGFGQGDPRVRSYSTLRRTPLPGLAPPANGIP